MASPEGTTSGVSPAKRKTAKRADQADFPMLLADGQALTRHDIQFDLLAQIFSNVHFRFTPPSYADLNTALFPTDRTWSFAELYLDCICNSPKATKTLKDKMAESQDFAVNFGKTGLLLNVGRINTTLAFYHEMKTLMRTYHPIPAFQIDHFTAKHLQDTPRLKTQLKAATLESERAKGAAPPANLREVAMRAAAGHRPPTSVIELIFLLNTESVWVSEKYFPAGLKLGDLFRPEDSIFTITSAQRSHAFLWLLHRFLEGGSAASEDAISPIVRPAELLGLTEGDTSQENIDTPEELEFGRQMTLKRSTFLADNDMVKPGPGVAERANKSSQPKKGSHEDSEELPSLIDPDMRQTPHWEAQNAGPSSQRKRAHSELDTPPSDVVHQAASPAAKQPAKKIKSAGSPAIIAQAGPSVAVKPRAHPPAEIKPILSPALLPTVTHMLPDQSYPSLAPAPLPVLRAARPKVKKAHSDDIFEYDQRSEEEMSPSPSLPPAPMSKMSIDLYVIERAVPHRFQFESGPAARRPHPKADAGQATEYDRTAALSSRNPLKAVFARDRWQSGTDPAVGAFYDSDDDKSPLTSRDCLRRLKGFRVKVDDATGGAAYRYLHYRPARV
ncbi:uncharacterized protein L969DRAFT_91323 [Mixia osmundae IAM 14324]|uniref:uncharacterized protein n=1 Tax=Mixia osmundae (strain CBS 9802 / IAM 14324 / JCM 22182 / KY 12970) TaxID=764103 RepID=UPI0004A55448|nr:uncharacterized protein L969DRAFT_91323 [Mixia osmundae IAM 14324]KEI41842.1 hypothetical protein L969DRAFT_91323 [Mixia osmundae IAM 14324]